jgi:hypothetical protein
MRLPSRPALYRRAVAVHRQAIHCRAVHCAKLSIASCPLQHCWAVHRSIAKPFFASCPSQAVHRCIIELSSSITCCPSLYRQAVQRFIAEPSIAKPSIAEPSIASRLVFYCRAVHREPSSIEYTMDLVW